MNLKFQHPGDGLHETEYSSRPPHAGQASVLRTPAAWPSIFRVAPPAAPGLIFVPDFSIGADEILFV